MSAGDPTYDLLQLEDDAGTAASYANKAAFTGAGWALTFKDIDGVSLSPQPTYTVADQGAGLHRINLDEPSEPCFAIITVPTGYYTPRLVLEFTGEPYDLADIYALILSNAQGTTAGVGSARVSDTLEDWVDGDSFSMSVVFTAAQLAKIGKTTLTGVTVLAGAKKNFPAADSQDDEDIAFEVAVTDVAALTADITLDDFPDAAKLADGVESVPYVIDVTIVNDADSRRYTALRYEVSIVWQAELETGP